MLQEVRRDGLHLIEAPLLEEELGVRAAFTCREGGISAGPYLSFNLSYNVADQRGNVKSNRRRLAGAVGIAIEDWVFCRQVHGACVSVVGPLEVGRGSVDQMSAIPRSDGLAIRLEKVVLAVLTADCVPVVMVAPEGNAVSVVHVGWRGALAGVMTSALGKLRGIAGCAPGGVISLIGPHIGPCCLEVGGEVADRFKAVFSDEVIVERPDHSVAVDLGAACRMQLESEGVRGGNIFDAGICTRCDERYFSHRGSCGPTGRQAGLVAITG